MLLTCCHWLFAQQSMTTSWPIKSTNNLNYCLGSIINHLWSHEIQTRNAIIKKVLHLLVLSSSVVIWKNPKNSKTVSYSPDWKINIIGQETFFSNFTPQCPISLGNGLDRGYLFHRTCVKIKAFPFHWKYVRTKTTSFLNRCKDEVEIKTTATPFHWTDVMTRYTHFIGQL